MCETTILSTAPRREGALAVWGLEDAVQIINSTQPACGARTHACRVRTLANTCGDRTQALTGATSDPCWERLWRQKARFSATLAKCISAQPLVSICIRCTPVPSRAFWRVCVNTGALYTHRTGRIVDTFRSFF